jgi:hypothetical protein
VLLARMARPKEEGAELDAAWSKALVLGNKVALVAGTWQEGQYTIIRIVPDI